MPGAGYIDRLNAAVAAGEGLDAETTKEVDAALERVVQVAYALRKMTDDAQNSTVMVFAIEPARDILAAILGEQ